MQNQDFTENQSVISTLNDSKPIEAEVMDNYTHYNIELKEDYIERWGFNAVINNPSSPNESFETLLTSRKSHAQESRTLLDEAYKKDIERYELQIADLKLEIEDNITRLIEYEDNIELYKTESDTLIKEIETLEEEIADGLQILGRKKASLIQDRIKQARQELEELIKTLNEVADQKNGINEKNFSQNKEVLLKEAKLFERFSSHYEAAYQKIEKQLISLSDKGITPAISKFFIVIGVSSTGIAGWLFSIFSSQRGLNSDGWLFFILQSLLEFGEKIKVKVQHPFSEVIWIALFIGGILFLLILIFLISLGCQMLIEKFLKEKQEEGKIEFNGNWDNKLKFSKKVKSNSFVGLWLQIFPYVFILAITYVIIQSGSSIGALESLDEALSGQIAGSTLAFMIGGLGYAYITYIVAPRKENNNPIDESSSHSPVTIANILKRNIELLILAILFLVTLILMYFFNEQGGGALVGFALSSILSGFLLGTGLRYKGLYEARNQIENDLMYFQYRIKNNSRPIPLYMTRWENKIFRERYIQLENELLELLIIKTGQIKETWPKTFWQVNKVSRILPRWLFKMWLRWNPLKQKEPRKNVILTPFEEVQFPEEKLLLNRLQQKLKRKDEKLIDVEKSIKELKDEQTEYQKSKQQTIKDLKTKIEQYLKKCSDRIKLYKKQVDLHNGETIQEETKLKEGFELGIWFIEHNTTLNT